MKALSIQPAYATAIATGLKWIELRTWKTDYRGWILICSSEAINSWEEESLVTGHGIALAELEEVRPYDDDRDHEDAMLFDDEDFEGYAWLFKQIVPIKPVPIKEQEGLFDVDYEIDDLQAVELDFEGEDFLEDIFAWWKESGLIQNLDFLGDGNEDEDDFEDE